MVGIRKDRAVQNIEGVHLLRVCIYGGFTVYVHRVLRGVVMQFKTNVVTTRCYDALSINSQYLTTEAELVSSRFAVDKLLISNH